MNPKDITRRDFASALIVGGSVVASATSAKADSHSELELGGPEGPVEVTVSIVWLPEGDPVVGASVYEHEENTLLGKTDEAGKFITTVPNGTVLRLVEPAYGKQQALRLVQGELSPSRSIRVSAVGEGWTIS